MAWPRASLRSSRVASSNAPGHRERHELAVAVAREAGGTHPEPASTRVMARPAMPRVGWAMRVSVMAACLPLRSSGGEGGRREEHVGPPLARDEEVVEPRGRPRTGRRACRGAGCPARGRGTPPRARPRRWRLGRRRRAPRTPRGQVVAGPRSAASLAARSARSSATTATWTRPATGLRHGAGEVAELVALRRAGRCARISADEARQLGDALVGGRPRGGPEEEQLGRPLGEAVARAARRRGGELSTTWKFVPPKPKALTPAPAVGRGPRVGRGRGSGTGWSWRRRPRWVT